MQLQARELPQSHVWSCHAMAKAHSSQCLCQDHRQVHRQVQRWTQTWRWPGPLLLSRCCPSSGLNGNQAPDAMAHPSLPRALQLSADPAARL